MNKLTSGLLAALATLAASPSALAKDTPGFDPQAVQGLDGLPVHVVMLNDRLRAQVAYQYVSVDSTITDNMVMNMATMPGVSYGQAAGVGVAGGLIAGALINAAEKQAQRDLVEPAYASLETAGCALPGGDVFAPAIEAGVRTAPWAASAPLARHQLAGKTDKLREVLDEGKPRYVLSVSYSLTPDFAALLTTIDASAYGPDLAGVGTAWQRKPAWTDRIVVVSEPMQLGEKTAEEIALAVARENARFEALGVGELVKKAKKGDADARQEAAILIRRHKLNVRDANQPTWTPVMASLRRSELWSADNCARLRQALQANAADSTHMLGKLFAGELNASLPRDWLETIPGGWTKAAVTPRNLDAAAPTERRIYAEGAHQFVSRRAGDDVTLAFRYAWLPEKD